MNTRAIIADFEGASSYIPKETFLSVMSMALKDVPDLANLDACCRAYMHAGYRAEEIVEHHTECLRRERIRRSIAGMKERACA